jgi:hypothetical protein
MGENSQKAWKVSISDEPTVEVDEQAWNNLHKLSATKHTFQAQLYRSKKLTIKFLSPFPDDRNVYKRVVITEKTSRKPNICEENSEPFVKLYWAFSYFNARGINPIHNPDLMLYKMKNDWTVINKWHMKNVNVVSFSIESSLMPSIENCSMDVIPESFWLI